MGTEPSCISAAGLDLEATMLEGLSDGGSDLIKRLVN